MQCSPRVASPFFVHGTYQLVAPPSSSSESGQAKAKAKDEPEPKRMKSEPEEPRDSCRTVPEIHTYVHTLPSEVPLMWRSHSHLSECSLRR